MPLPLLLLLLSAVRCTYRTHMCTGAWGYCRPQIEGDSELVDNSATMSAVCVMKGTEGVTGTITMTEADGAVTIKGKLEGLKPGLHGFHIHQLGDTTNGCVLGRTHHQPDVRSHPITLPCPCTSPGT